MIHLAEYPHAPRCSQDRVVENDYGDRVILNEEQSNQLGLETMEIAHKGGPQVCGSADAAKRAAQRLTNMLTASQRDAMSSYAMGKTPFLMIEDIETVDESPVPSELPSIDELRLNPGCLYLASRSQIILSMVENKAFAFDLDYNEMVRLVGNFKGGGANHIKGEPSYGKAELSSHSGLALGAHTEPPYFCCQKPSGQHSPAPSTLILTARWNPLCEPTTIIPMESVIQNLTASDKEALSKPNFRFTRPDSYIEGQDDGVGVSILDLHPRGSFSLRFNSYRFSVVPGSPSEAHRSLKALQIGIKRTRQERVVLQRNKSILINNYTSMHCRDVIKDNRRLLIRMFGYHRDVGYIANSQDPLLVKG